MSYKVASNAKGGELFRNPSGKRHARYIYLQRGMLGPSITGDVSLTFNEQHQIIINAFWNPRFGVSPTATKGAVESYARKHDLSGEDYAKALDSAIMAGLLAPMSGSSLTIRNAGRAMLPRR